MRSKNISKKIADSRKQLQIFIFENKKHPSLSCWSQNIFIFVQRLKENRREERKKNEREEVKNGTKKIGTNYVKLTKAKK